MHCFCRLSWWGEAADFVFRGTLLPCLVCRVLTSRWCWCCPPLRVWRTCWDTFAHPCSRPLFADAGSTIISPVAARARCAATTAIWSVTFPRNALSWSRLRLEGREVAWVLCSLAANALRQLADVCTSREAGLTAGAPCNHGCRLTNFDKFLDVKRLGVSLLELWWVQSSITSLRR